MEVWDNIWSTLTATWKQNTVIWIILAGIIGGIITQLFKFAFEQTIPRWQQKKAIRIAIQKYSVPITQSAYILSNTIEDILNKPDILNDQNLRMGFFEWERTIDVECYCGHKQNSHLDGIEICLNGLCICEKFEVDKKVEVVISPKAIARKNLPKISDLNDESMTVHSNGKAYQ